MKQYGLPIVCFLIILTFGACAPSEGPTPGTAGPAASTTPFPDSVYKAQITIVSQPQTLRAAEQGTFRVKVKNVGNGTWPAQGQGPKYKFDLGNHWQDKKGVEVVGDDGRTGLPHDLKSGEEAELLLTVKAPKTPGDYIVVLDMVHEDVTWFALHGSQTVKANLTVQ